MKKLLSLLFLLPVLAKAQPSAIYGSSLFGGKFKQGAFVCWNNDTVTQVPYYRTVNHPYVNMLSHNGRIYGLSASDFDNRFRASTCKLFYADSVQGQLYLINDRTTRGTGNLGGKDKFPGFSVDQDYLAISNYYQGAPLEVYRLSDLQLVAEINYTTTAQNYARPTVKGDLVYYFVQNGVDLTLNEFNIVSGVTRNVLATTYDVFGTPSGPPVIENNKLFVSVEGFGNQGGIRAVDLTTSVIDTVTNFNFDDGYQSYGSFCKVGEWYYNVCTKSNNVSRGSIYRFHPGTFQFEYLYNFDLNAGTPLYGLVNFKDKLYGIISSVDGENKNAVFEYEISGSNFKVIKKFPAITQTNQTNYYATNLVVHNNELYVVAPISPNGENGSITKVDVSGSSHVEYNHYLNSSNSLGRGKTIYTNGKFYGAADSSIYSYNVADKSIQKVAELDVNGGNITAYTHGLAVYKNKIYGVGLWHRDTIYNKVLYSVDLNNSAVTILKELLSGGFDLWDEMCVVDNKLYFDQQGGENNYIFEYNIQTGDTIQHLVPTAGCEYINASFAQNDKDLYYSTFSRDCADNGKGKLFKYSTTYRQFEQLVDFNTKPNRQAAYNNILFHENKLIGIVNDTLRHSMIYEYDLQTSQYKEVMVFEDSLVAELNIHLNGDVVYGIATSGANRVLYFYDLNSKVLSYYFEEPNITLLNGMLFLNSPYNSTGLKEINAMAEARWDVVPNPASREIKFKALTADKNAKLSISDISGKLIYEGSSENVVNIESWNSGVYVVRFLDRNGLSVRRFVKS